MTIPKYDDITLPLLKLLSDGQIRESKSLVPELAKHFNLSKEQLEELLPSGTQAIFFNRVGWAKTHLYKAGLVDNSTRGYVKITDLGKKVLSENPKKLDNNYLFRFPEFKEFFKGKSKVDTKQTSNLMEDRTPIEILDNVTEQLKTETIVELKNKIKQLDPYQFEKLVVKVLLSLGYGGNEKEAGIALGKSGDGGVDGVIKQDKLGIEEIYVQAKQYKEDSSIGRPMVQAFVGALHGKRSRKGVLITTSHFSKDAIEYTNTIETKIILIDGNKLAELMFENNIGVKIERTYLQKGVDQDFFEEWI